VKIVIVDYGMGNIHSVARKIKLLGFEYCVSARVEDVLSADRIILPGVGHFGKAMQNLKELNLIESLNEAVLIKKTPILGICLGMQLMARSSEEGNSVGLGWVDAEVVPFTVSDTFKFKVPHTGWNSIQKQKESSTNNGLSDEEYFYFVHSFHFLCTEKLDILHITSYDYEFTSAVEKENILGVQYHPEKSHEAGLTLLKNFISG
jgi:glutamine amidotransferase